MQLTSWIEMWLSIIGAGYVIYMVYLVMRAGIVYATNDSVRKLKSENQKLNAKVKELENALDYKAR